MKEFEGKATWRVSEWGEEMADRVVVRVKTGHPSHPVDIWHIRHEDQIEHHLPSAAPDDLKAYVRREVLRCRPLAENELRDSHGIWQFRMHGGGFQWRLLGGLEYWGSPFTSLDIEFGEPRYAAARAWRDRQWQDVEGAEGYAIRQSNPANCSVKRPNGTTFNVFAEALADGLSQAFAYPEPVIRACCKLLGVEREERLADNQVLVTQGRLQNELCELRWNEGSPEAKRLKGNHSWESWTFGFHESGDAWFRANCPADRFVTDSGEVRSFVMRDDGEAATVDGALITGGNIDYSACRNPVWPALHKFRDVERGKWKFIPHENGCIDVQGPDGSWCGVGVDGALYKPALMPTWVRNRVEAMWREREPKWETRWNFSGCVDIFRMRNWVGCYTGGGAQGGSWPPHIALDARAKYRANYTLKADEIWFQGMPVRMEFVPDRIAKDDGRLLEKAHVSSANFDWREVHHRSNWQSRGTFTNDAERLEAYDRMRAFYYEKLAKREKGVTFEGKPAVFRADNNVQRVEGRNGRSFSTTRPSLESRATSSRCQSLGSTIVFASRLRPWKVRGCDGCR